MSGLSSQALALLNGEFSFCIHLYLFSNGYFHVFLSDKKLKMQQVMSHQSFKQPKWFHDNEFIYTQST